MPTTGLVSDIALASQVLGDALEAIKDAPLPELLLALDEMKILRTSVATVGADLENRAGEAMPDKRVTVGGVEWVKSKPPSRTQWQTDDLLHRVQDSVLADGNGEIQPETPLEKVLHVWNLGAPRLTALDERGIDRDEFCRITWPDDARWKVARAADMKPRKRANA